MTNGWNPWHGCTKISPGCLHCYVYRIDACHQKTDKSSQVIKTSAFTYPIDKNRYGQYKLEKGTMVYTCFSSDFFHEVADEWRHDAWYMIRERSDCTFFFFTKRIDRFPQCIPNDWGEGYNNVKIGCTVENQQMADKRLPLFLSYPIKHRVIGVEPILENVSLKSYLNPSLLEGVSVGGESGDEARICRYEWITSLRDECLQANVPFTFHQTGALFEKEGKMYHIPRNVQGKQAKLAKLDTIMQI